MTCGIYKIENKENGKDGGYELTQELNESKNSKYSTHNKVKRLNILSVLWGEVMESFTGKVGKGIKERYDLYLQGRDVDGDKTKEKYRSRCWSVETGRQKFLGYFNNQEDAHHAWKNFKAIQATLLANEQTDPRIVKALLERYLE